MKKKFWAMILALVIAIVIWLEINITKIHEVNITIPISITNAPAALIPLSIEPESINLVIEGTGKNILFYNSNKQPYCIDLKDAHYGKNYYPIRLENLKVLEEYHLKILRKPASENVLIAMDNMSSKFVPITITFIDEESKQFFQKNGLTISPKKIRITGPKTLITDIYEIKTLPFNMKNFQNNSQIKLTPSPSEKISFEHSLVLVKKMVPKIIQKTFSLLPISTDEGIEIFPNTVSIKVSGEEEILQNINPEDFIAEVDTSASLEIDSLVSVKVCLPEGIELIAQTPKFVRVKNVQE